MPQTYTFAEMSTLDALVSSLREVDLVAFTADSVLEELAPWEPALPPDKRPTIAAALAKLREEPRAKLAAWLTGKADWLCLGEERFELIQSEAKTP